MLKTQQKDWREEFNERYIRGDFGNLELKDIQEFCLKIEQQAYARASEVARTMNHDEAEVRSAHRTCERVAKEIEQLASNKE